jgi:hypothetical protein
MTILLLFDRRCSDRQLLETAPSFAPLRGREVFRALLAELATNAKGAPK